LNSYSIERASQEGSAAHSSSELSSSQASIAQPKVQADSQSSNSQTNQAKEKSSSIITSESSIVGEEDAESDLSDSSLNSSVEIAPKGPAKRKK